MLIVIFAVVMAPERNAHFIQREFCFLSFWNVLFRSKHFIYIYQVYEFWLIYETSSSSHAGASVSWLMIRPYISATFTSYLLNPRNLLMKLLRVSCVSPILCVFCSVLFPFSLSSLLFSSFTCLPVIISSFSPAVSCFPVYLSPVGQSVPCLSLSQHAWLFGWWFLCVRYKLFLVYLIKLLHSDLASLPASTSPWQKYWLKLKGVI